MLWWAMLIYHCHSALWVRWGKNSLDFVFFGGSCGCAIISKIDTVRFEPILGILVIILFRDYIIFEDFTFLWSLEKKKCALFHGSLENMLFFIHFSGKYAFFINFWKDLVFIVIQCRVHNSWEVRRNSLMDVSS